MVTPGAGTDALASDELRRIDEYRREKNTSVLVVMFTDLTGSTRLAEDRGEDAYNALRRHHNDILLGIIERDGAGRFVKNIGDAIMAVFAKPSDAVERALEIQHALREHNADAEPAERIVVRIGMHMGQVAKDNATATDVFGRHVNRAARVESLTPPGHILVTQPVYDSAKGWIDSGRFAFVLHGKYRLKGIAEAVELIEPYEKGQVRPTSPRIASWRERLRRWPLVPLAMLLACAFFLTLLNAKITPLIHDRIARAGATLDSADLWGPGWEWISSVLKLSGWIGEYWMFGAAALAAVLLVDHFMHVGIAVARRRQWLLAIVASALALLTGVIYFAQTCAMALMLSE